MINGWGPGLGVRVSVGIARRSKGRNRPTAAGHNDRSTCSKKISTLCSPLCYCTAVSSSCNGAKRGENTVASTSAKQRLKRESWRHGFGRPVRLCDSSKRPLHGLLNLHFLQLNLSAWRLINAAARFAHGSLFPLDSPAAPKLCRLNWHQFLAVAAKNNAWCPQKRRWSNS